MTGWRLGYCGGPKEIVNAMSTIQGQSTSNACSITQKAALAALNGDQAPVDAMNEQFKKRHDYFIAALNSLPGISALPCAGAFYAWADCSAAMAAFGIKDDNVFAEMLITDAGVAVVPGSGFGAPNHFRASFATSMATLEKCIERMRKVLERGPVAKTPDGLHPRAARALQPSQWPLGSRAAAAARVRANGGRRRPGQRFGPGRPRQSQRCGLRPVETSRHRFHVLLSGCRHPQPVSSRKRPREPPYGSSSCPATNGASR